MTPQPQQGNTDLVNNQEGGLGAGSSASPNNNSVVLCGPSVSEDEDELTESKIRAFLDEKVLASHAAWPLYEAALRHISSLAFNLVVLSSVLGS